MRCMILATTAALTFMTGEVQSESSKPLSTELGGTIAPGFPFNLPDGTGAIALVVDPSGHPVGMYSRTQIPQPAATSPELERRDLPVTEDDLRILLKAQELLKNNSVWNRQDDRDCVDDETTGKRSLFCALQKACVHVLGVYDHRRVALQEVRFAVEDATRGQDFEHRLRDFNNLPTTQLADIRMVLQVATNRVKARLKSR